MNLMQEALGLHATTLQAAAGEKITYRRGTQSVVVSAVPGETEFEEFGSEGEFRAQIKYTDWLIKPGCLKFDGQPITPERGDEIERKDGERFHVLPGNQNATWRWANAHRTHYRIHSLRVES